MRLRRWYTGGTMPPYRPDSDHIPALLSPCSYEIWDESHTFTEAELDRLFTNLHTSRTGALAMFTTAEGGVVYGFDVPAPAPRLSWWRRMLRWRP